MLRMSFLFLTYLLAAYGAFCMLISLVSHMRLKGTPVDSRVRLVLIVRNAGEKIEGVIRSIFIENTLKKIIPGGRLFVLDMGSMDDTIGILSRLQKEYGEMEVLREGEKDRVFAVFSQE